MSTRVSRPRVEESPTFFSKDHISSLPECVISYILSLLPIKDAIRTCVLSKVWEYKWTSISNVDVADIMPSSSPRDEKTTFPDFVDRILFLLQNVKSFRLGSLRAQYLTHIISWITAVSKKNIESLEVDCLSPNDALLLPHALFHNTSLRKLKLWLSSIFMVPSKVFFPNLTSLDLYAVEIRNELSNRLLLSFPVLESFELSDCTWSNSFVEISAPALTYFKSGTMGDARVDDYSIEIFAPRLAVFQSSGGSLENIILTGSAVVSATLNNMEEKYDLQLLGKTGLQARKLLEGFSSLEDLMLSGSVAEGIIISKQDFVLPMFNKLEQLVLYAYTSRESLLELLHLAPSLKFLSIDVNFVTDFNYEALQYIPSCIVSHLQKVEFEAVDGGIFTFPLAKFLLKNGVNLERISIGGIYDVPSNEIVEQLYTFPRASTCLTIVAS